MVGVSSETRRGSMMKWAFLYTLDEPGMGKRVDTIGPLICVGVPNIVDAPAVARELLANGVELIELCGGFGGAGLGAVVAAVEGRIPVGAVFYGVDAANGLNRIFPDRR
jgi:hypothetical protein